MKPGIANIELNMEREAFGTSDIVAIMNAAGFTTCFVALCAVIGIAMIIRAVRVSNERENERAHALKMERLRLENTKEITVR